MVSFHCDDSNPFGFVDSGKERKVGCSGNLRSFLTPAFAIDKGPGMDCQERHMGRVVKGKNRSKGGFSHNAEIETSRNDLSRLNWDFERPTRLDRISIVPLV